MKQIASAFLYHFVFGGPQALISLSPSAPADLKLLTKRLCGPRPHEAMSCLYEGLAAIAEAQPCQVPSFDPEICPVFFMRELADELARMERPASERAA